MGLPSLLSAAVFATMFACLAAPAPAVTPDPGPVHDFTIIAGNAFFDRAPALGSVCRFDFGDPAGAYNVLTGYNAAHIYQTPGTYTLKIFRAGLLDGAKTIHVLPNNRGLLTLTPRDNLFAVVRNLANNTTVLLPSGTTWDLPGQIEIKARNIEFRPAGPGPAPRIRRTAAKGSSSVIVTGMDVVFRGIEFDSDKDMAEQGNNNKVNYRGISLDGAHVVCVGCTFRNLDDDLFCTPLTRGLLAQWCKFTDETRSCDFWLDGTDVTVLGCTMATSQREHNMRSASPLFYNLLLHDSDLTATHGKETLTFRGGQDCYASCNRFHTGWVRTGPGPHSDHRPFTADELRKAFARHIVFDRNAFVDGSFLGVNEGTFDITAKYNRFDIDHQSVAVHVQGPSVKDFILEENYRVLTEGPSPKPIMRVYDEQESEIIERGNSFKTKEEAEALKGK